MNRAREPHLRMPPATPAQPAAQPPQQQPQAVYPPVEQQPVQQYMPQPPVQQPYPPQSQQWGGGGGYPPPQPPAYGGGYYPQQPPMHPPMQQAPYQQYPVTTQHMMMPQPVAQPPEYDSNLDDPEPHAPRPSAWRVLLAIGGLIGIAGLSWLAYYWSPSYDGPPPLIPAPDGPYKIKPESPGGATIAYRDTLVYDRLAQNPNQVSGEQNVVILPEEPPMASTYHSTQTQQQSQPSPMQTTPLAQMTQQQQLVEPQIPPGVTTGPQQPTTQPHAVQPQAVQPQAVQPQTEQPQTARQEMDSMLAKLSDIQEIPTSNKPVYFLQMATLKSEGEAVKEMRRLKNKLHLQQSKWHVKKNETSSGAQYALLLGPYTSQEEARKRCGSIKNGCKVVAAE